MDIRDWPNGGIMQLPDCCFGRRWPVVFGGVITAPTSTVYYISELALPERCVLWELGVGSEGVTTKLRMLTNYSFKVGDQLPATAAEFVAMEDMFPGCDEVLNGARIMRDGVVLRRLRVPIASAGRRVVLRVGVPGDENTFFVVGLVFSSFPTEVPDWLSLEKASYP